MGSGIEVGNRGFHSAGYKDHDLANAGEKMRGGLANHKMWNWERNHFVQVI